MIARHREATTLLVLLGLVASGPRCKKDEREWSGLGEACKEDWECQRSLHCGEEGVCISYEVARERFDARRVQEAKSTAPPPVTGPRVPFSVKVRRIDGKGNSIYAQCAANERLVGGGCLWGSSSDGIHILEDGPESYTEDDTLGARWRCGWNCTDCSLQAYALCMWVPPEPAAPVEPAAEGPTGTAPAQPDPDGPARTPLPEPVAPTRTPPP